MSVATGTTNYFTAPQHELLRAQVRDFAESNVVPRIGEMEKSKVVNVELSRLIAQQGWLGVTVNPKYGGMGLGHLAKTIIIEELSRVSGAMGAMVQASQLGVAKIVHFGSEEQKRHWLPAICDGNCMPTMQSPSQIPADTWSVCPQLLNGWPVGMSSTGEKCSSATVISATCMAWSCVLDRVPVVCQRSWCRRTRGDFRWGRTGLRWACTASVSAN